MIVISRGQVVMFLLKHLLGSCIGTDATYIIIRSVLREQIVISHQMEPTQTLVQELANSKEPNRLSSWQ